MIRGKKDQEQKGKKYLERQLPLGYCKRKDAFAVSVRFAASNINCREDIPIHNVNRSQINIYKKAKNFVLDQDQIPGPGFSRREGDRSNMFGARYIGDYE